MENNVCITQVQQLTLSNTCGSSSKTRKNAACTSNNNNTAIMQDTHQIVNTAQIIWHIQFPGVFSR